MADDKPVRRYADHEIKAGLAAMLIAGTAEKASEQTGISESTLRSWKRRKPQLWADVQAMLAPQLDALVLTQARELAVTWAELEQQIAERMADAIPKLDPRDVPGAARNISTARAISVDKLNVLSGRPSVVIEHRSTSELVKTLGGHVDGTAEEID